MCEGTCEYVARQSDPESWGGEHSAEWFLDCGQSSGGLGIGKWRCPHPKLERDGAQYCVFHTDPEKVPDHVDESKRLRQALDNAGETPYDDGPEHRGQFVGATFGAIDLSGETIAADEHDRRFDHATFRADNGDVDFTKTKFITRNKTQLSFHRAEFLVPHGSESLLRFRRSQFKTEGEGDVWFEWATFESNSRGTVLFNGATFEAAGDGEIRFERVDFRAIGGDFIDFGNTTFQTAGGGEVRFGDVMFETTSDANVSFKNAIFSTNGSDLWFRKATFRTGADGDIQFDNSTFDMKNGGDAQFKSSEFRSANEGDISFRGTDFTADDRSCIWFDSTIFKTDGNVDFYGVSLGDAILRYAYFLGVDMRDATLTDTDLRETTLENEIGRAHV
jgi:uncharacterized protein YjbI with pentapeptide repeats